MCSPVRSWLDGDLHRCPEGYGNSGDGSDPKIFGLSTLELRDRRLTNAERARQLALRQAVLHPQSDQVIRDPHLG